MAPNYSRHQYDALPAQRGPPCAPLQRILQAIHMIEFDINGKTPSARKRRIRQYKDGIRRRLHRAKAIGPLTYYSKPVTPSCNPANPRIRMLKKDADPRKPSSWFYDPETGHSYHIIQMVDSGGTTGKRVQLLISDYNQYLVAFRRELDGVWTTWFHCSDWPLPDHFGAVKLPVDGDHGIRSTMGGNECLKSMFYGLANYPENKEDTVTLQKALLRAVVFFCEAIRLRIIYDEMIKRLGLTMNKPTDLTEYMWNQIGAYGNLCELVLNCGYKNGYVNEETLQRLIRDKKMTNLYKLIAHQESELMLLLRKDSVLLPKGTRLTIHQAVSVVDPGFPAPEAGLA